MPQDNQPVGVDKNRIPERSYEAPSFSVFKLADLVRSGGTKTQDNIISGTKRS